VFPRGIPIGRVGEQLGEETGWARSYAVQPAAYPGEAREVMVMVGRGELGDLWRGEVADADR
jgi:cell shape-determining protein MreC